MPLTSRVITSTCLFISTLVKGKQLVCTHTIVTFMTVRIYQGLLQYSVVWKMKEGMIFAASVMGDIFKQQKVHKVHFIALETLGEMAFNREKSV